MKQFTARQKQIIQASLDIIATSGNKNLTIKNISKKIGISEPAIYRHFNSKMDILLGIIHSIKDNRGVDYSELDIENLSYINKIRKALAVRAYRFTKNPSLAAVIFSEEIFDDKSQLSEAVAEVMDDSLQRMVNIISQGQNNGEIIDIIDAEDIGLLIIGSFRLLVTKWHMSKYNFDLVKSTEKLMNAIEKLI